MKFTFNMSESHTSLKLNTNCDLKEDGKNYVVRKYEYTISILHFPAIK
jgi:hypothetical protein